LFTSKSNMADAKISELTELVSPTVDDVLAMVDDPAGTPTTKKTTLVNLLKAAWPVGAVFISVVSTNPNTLLGFGTWAAFGAGKVLVGLDSGDTSFDTVEETGGAKTVQSSAQTFAGTASTTVVNHVHVQRYGTPATGNFTTSAVVDTSSGGTGGTAGSNVTAVSTSNPTGGAADYTPVGTNTPGAATSVVQPYIVVYMFKRTA